MQMDNAKEECLYAAGDITVGRVGGAGGLGRLVSTQSVLMNRQARVGRGKGMTTIRSQGTHFMPGSVLGTGSLSSRSL